MAKAAPKLQIRNFLPVTTSGMDKRDPAMSMTLAVNRLGATVTDVGKILTSSHQARLDAAYQVQGRRSLAQDRAREKQIEKKTAENIDKESEARGYKKGGSGIFGLLSPLIEPLIQFAGTLATFFALDFLSKKENRQAIETGFSWIGKWLGTVWKIGSKGFSMLYDGLFDPDGNDGPLMRALKVVGGLASIFVAGRILRPWKIAGDIGKLSKLFSGNRKAGVKQQRAIQQRQMRNSGTRPGLKGKPMKPGGGGKLLGKMGKFFKSPVGAGALSGVFAFGSRLAAGDKLNVAAGGGIGAAIGTTAVTALLVPVLGPFAPLVGGVLGGFFGDKIGAFLGEAIEPILGPIGDFFKNVAMPVWKAYLTPLIEPLKELFPPLKAFFGLLIDTIAPIAGKVFQGLMDWLIGPMAKAALDGIIWIIEKASWFINNGVKIAQGTVNTFTRVFGSDSQKKLAQVENEDYDVQNLTKQLAKIKKRQDKGKGGSRSIWFGVDGVIRTSNGAPGMHMGNGHGNPLGSTNDEKAKHWEEVLIPHAKKKAREAHEAAAQIEMAQPQTDMVSDPSSIANKGTGPDDSPVTSGGRIDFQGHGDGATGVLRLFDANNKKVGQWEAISGTYGTAGASQKQRRNVSGTNNPLPDGTYPLVGFAEHSNVKGIGIWSTFINNMAGSIGKRSAIQLHNDINDNGTAGCVGVTLGGTAGNKRDKDFVEKYKQVMPDTIRVAIGKGAKKLSTGAVSSPDNTEIRPTDLNSTKTSELTASSQRQDTELSSGESSQVVVMQPVIKTVKETVGVDNTQIIHTDPGFGAMF